MVLGMTLKTYSRTFSDLFNPIIEEGFVLKKIIEPKPIPKSKKIDVAYYEKTMKRPYFIIIEAFK